MAAVVGTFPCPTITVAQACLLLAYKEFGKDRDGDLSIYLGTSIRMAQDLGIRYPKDFSLKAGLDRRQRQQSMDSVEKRKRREEHQRQITERMLANNADTASMEDRRASE
jgi:hypothetical protein